MSRTYVTRWCLRASKEYPHVLLAIFCMNRIITMFRTLFSLPLFFVYRILSVARSALAWLWFSALLGITGGALIVVVMVLNHVTWAMHVEIPVFGQLQNRHVGESTKLYDRSGKTLLYDTGGSMRQITIPLREISPYMIKATIAIEDADFYEHKGVRPSAIFRALHSNINTMSLNQGGSTITQQVIKNTLLTNDKKLTRKIREWVLALRLEEQYSKEEILETYLNETPYGGVMYGVEEASRTYFGKVAKDLTLSEAAYLAALPKAPTYFSPWGPNRALLTERHNLVLRQMREQAMISENEYQSARVEVVRFIERSSENIRAPHFVFYVLDELVKKYGEQRIYGEGVQVVTTLNLELQQESEEIISAGALANEKKFNASNAGLVAIDPQSGQVLAMVGSRNYFDDSVDGQVNVALALRQPGSAFKPFVYATAFKKGYTPNTVLYDLRTQFSTACAPSNLSSDYPCYSPVNYDGKYKGPMSMRDALAQSVNVVGVKTLYLSGIEASINTARSLGITTLKDAKHYGLALVLGGGEVTLLQMTGAYGAFANDGMWNPTTPILAVRTVKGEVLESYTSTPKKVLDPEVARTINDVLSDNIARTPAFGSESPLHFKHADVADKTGTTNDYRDMWVVGYTPTIVVGAWAGNNDNTPMVKKTSSFILAPIWHAVMEKAIARFPSGAFQEPSGNGVFSPVPLALASDTPVPPQAGVHEILFWVDKDNPLAGPPLYPYADPQLALWDYPVFLWNLERTLATLTLQLQQIISSIPPPFDTSGSAGTPLTGTAPVPSIPVSEP